MTDDKNNGGVPEEAVSDGQSATGQPPHTEVGSAPAPRSRRARSQIVIFANFVMTLLVLVIVGAVAVLYGGDRLFNDPGPLPKATDYMVRKGAGVSEIANGLASENIVSSARLFRLATRIYMRHDTLKAGEYKIPAHASMTDVMTLLRSGKSILYSLTFPEGLTVRQMFARLADDGKLTGPLPEKVPPEGSLMPETYEFTRGTSRREIVAKMTAADHAAVDEVWKNRDRDVPLESKSRMVTLASIVEKETGKKGERPQVAAVFLNRLRKGMRLQSDPTVIYGIFGGKGKPSGRPLYQSDLDARTPYNTYRIDGLPPTPIANPGRASLHAVAHPAKTDALYFVADGTGGHVFSSTLKEHNANVRRWREIQAARKKESGKTEDGGATTGD